MKSFLLKVSLAGIQILANTESWCSFQPKNHHILHVKSYGVFCINSQFLKNNSITNTIVPYSVHGFLSNCKNAYAIAIKNHNLHLGKLQEIFQKYKEKQRSYLKKSFQIFTQKDVLPVNYTAN